MNYCAIFLCFPLVLKGAHRAAPALGSFSTASFIVYALPITFKYNVACNKLKNKINYNKE